MTTQRKLWSRNIEFLLSVLGYSVGFGNIWRFPYLCMDNGGGAFLIPYIFFIIVCGAPMFLAELSIGQFSSLSASSIWNFSPIFNGVGWAMIALSLLVSIYCNILMSWVVYYLGMSFTWDLPWGTCGNEWNTPNCFKYVDLATKNNLSISSFNQSNTYQSYINSSQRMTSSVEEFYLYKALNISSSINELGGFNNHMLICFIVCWILTYLCVINSVKSVGKVAYVTATAPYILLTVIIIRGMLLPGSWLGISFYLIPKWENLLDFKVWVTAAAQMFYSLGPAWGGLISMASFNPFNSNVLRTATILPFVCCCTSIYCGLAIFSIVGHMAHVTGLNVTQVVESGQALAFVAYPQALLLIPGSSIWSVLFFLMLLTVGLDSNFGTYETVLQGIIDKFPNMTTRKKHIFTLSVTITLMLIGLPFTTRAAPYLFHIIDWYSTSIGVLIVAILEMIAIAYFYNWRKLILHIEMMIEYPLSKLLRYWLTACWCVLTPGCLLVIFIKFTTSIKQPLFNKTKEYPQWAILLGWTLAVCVFLPVPIMALKTLANQKWNFRQAFKANETFKRIEANRCSTTTSSDEKISLVDY